MASIRAADAKNPSFRAFHPRPPMPSASIRGHDSIAMFRIVDDTTDPDTGRFSFTGGAVDVPSPVCIAFRPESR